MSILKRLKDFRHSLFYWFVSSQKSETITLGKDWVWTIDPSGLSSGSIVYSAGVGDDISFENQLVERFDCKVLLLDPSPTGVATMCEPDNQHANYTFEQAGLAGKDGEITLGIPGNPTKASYFMTSSAENVMTLPAWSLSTLMRKYGHTYIDLLKMDIEGFEYGVLRSICEMKIPVRQICVEFHHSLVPGIARGETIKAILALRKAGYRLIHRKDWDHTFVKR